MRIGWTLLCLVAIAGAESPTEALARIKTHKRGLALPATDAMREEARTFLATWKAEKQDAAGQALSDLGQLHVIAGDGPTAFEILRRVAADGTLDEAVRSEARTRWALGITDAIDGLDAATRTRERAALKSLVENESIVLRPAEAGWLHRAAAYLAEADGDADAAVAAYRTAVLTQPGLASMVGREIGPPLAAASMHLDEYDGVRKRGAEVLAEFETAMADGLRPALARMHGRMFDRAAESTRSLLASLGNPAAEWKILHAFQKPDELAAFRKKVVLLYFWRTADASSVRGLASLRDLSERFAERPFAIVCVTWPAREVYASRFDLDPDLEGAGAAPEPLRMDFNVRDAEALAAFRKKEIEVIAAFAKNHSFAWPSVLVSAADARQKFGAARPVGPTVVLLDAEGRMRSVQSGAFARGTRLAAELVPARIESLLKEQEGR